MRKGQDTIGRSVAGHSSSRAGAAKGAIDPAMIRQVAGELRECLRTSGVHAALRLLNARVRFRYTGVYRSDPPWLRNVHLLDRENPTLNVSGGAWPLADMYCGLTCASNEPFATTNSRHDPRLRAHPARDAMISYAGVPIRTSSGQAVGTLCHWDVRPRLVPRGELAILEEASPLFAQCLREQGRAD